MIIKQVEIYKSPIRLKEPFVISLGLLSAAENVVVRILTDEGITGYGECSPFMTIHGESMDTCFIVGQYLAKVLMHGQIPEPGAATRAMDSVIFGNTSIKSAFDMALYDIAAQRAGLPLYEWIGGKNNKILKTDYTVSLGDPGKMAEDAKQIKADGFHMIKVKLGDTKENDVMRMIKIREAVGAEIPICIDANQGWSAKQAVDILKSLAPFHILYCEEPVSRKDFMSLPEIRRQSPIPIMADESCCDEHDAARLISLNACDCFNIKLGKSGGIFNALKIISLADQAGMKMQVGGFLESRLGFSAAAHLALTNDLIVYCDFDTPLMFEEDPVIGGIEYKANGEVNVPGIPGLGASMDEQYLLRLEKVILKNS